MKHNTVRRVKQECIFSIIPQPRKKREIEKERGEEQLEKERNNKKVEMKKKKG